MHTNKKYSISQFSFLLNPIRFFSFILVLSVNTGWANQANPEQIAIQNILSNNPWLNQNNNEIRLFSERESEVGHHFLFVQYHQNIEVYAGSIKINLAKNGKVLSVFNRLKPINQKLPDYLLILNAKSESAVYFLSGTNWVQAKKVKTINTKGEREERIYAVNGDMLHYRMLDLMVKKDTLVQTKVFSPDPLSSAQKIYGQDNLWKNFNGADSPELNGERKTKTLTLAISNDTFYAASPYAVIEDLESPAQTPFKSTSANFDFTRSHNEFRDFNCLYHIEQTRIYLNSIGISLAGMPPIIVDPTAYQGQDQSRFSLTFDDRPALFFGTGGVPDAEDADVVTHEYMHGIANFLSPNSTSGDERMAVEEANSDFMACQYSKNITTYNWRLVFNWDGHNEYWNGRNANSNNVYPKDLSSDFYVSSVIWSSMLNDLSEDLGRTVMTRILFNSIYSYANEMSMQEAADLLMQSDSLIYHYAHFSPLKSRLVQRGFMVYTGLNQLEKSTAQVHCYNSEGFAKGNAEMLISIDHSSELTAEIFSMNGEKIKGMKSVNGELILSPELFKAGIYLMQIKNELGEQFTQKLMRF